MSYPHRPSSATPSSEHPPHDPNAAAAQQHAGQSPIDWSNFMTFPTPPVSNAGPAGLAQQRAQSYNGGPGSGQNGNHGDPHKGYGQGMNMPSRPHQQQGGYPNPPNPYQPAASPSSRQYPLKPSPLQRQVSLPHTQNQLAQSPHMSTYNGKGKSPAVDRSMMNNGGQGSGGDNSTNADGLTLDADDFSRDIRFQVPSFLSAQMGGAPTFPPGGEAWSGFSGAGMFGNDQNQSLTPGQLFNQMFNLGMQNNDNHTTYAASPASNLGDRNVLEGLSGFMTDQGWEWSGENKDNPAGGIIPNMATYSYPNPSVGPSNMPRPPSSQDINQQRQQQPQQSQAQNQHQQQSRNQPNPSPRQRPAVPPLNLSHPPHSSGSQSATTPSQGPGEGFNGPRRSSTMPSGNGTMAPSAMQPFPQPINGGFPYVPSMSTPTGQSASTINIASSSTAPYAPPSNTQALLTAPVAAPFVGPNLAEGPGLYSTTGFDMVGVLAKVAARKDPKTVLGPVDFSCSFVVVDVRRYDCPIVYASPTFSALTGYELPQILGRNCRFLQSPDAEVIKGSKRKYTDNVAVAHLKRMLNAGKECQASLINYRRGGIPFINLVTVVPIPWEGTDIVYHVGFQIDLVEQPNAILRNMRDGSYQVNYTVANPPQPPLRMPGREPGVTGLSAEILDVMGARVNGIAFAQGEDGPKMEWLKMVLENSDDFIHVLSLKGLFQYVSPSVRRVLEYEPEDLLNKNISDICHPSDIVPLMRELKDSTHAPSDGNSAKTVNLVFRIRRKNTGYVWIECVGRLHVEPGKGRKAVILSGRARAVPSLKWDTVAKHGGLAETEFWAKISFEGLILHATSTVEDLLGQPAEDVVGQSIFSLLPGGDNGPPTTQFVEADPSSPVARVAAAFRSATSSKPIAGGVPVQHKMVTRTGQQIEVLTIFYPPKSSAELPPRSESGSSSPVSDSSSGPSSSTSLSGHKPSSIIVQIKSIPANVTANMSIASATNARPLAHAGGANLFEELETTRGTSWQYELHQLRVLNRRLRDQIDGAKREAKKGGAAKTKKRKAGDQDGQQQYPGGPSNPPGTIGSAQPGQGMPEQFAAAPRHQLAPGFGLVAPGMPSPYY